MNNPHYLKGATKKMEYENVENIPIAELDIPIKLVTSSQKRSDKYLTIDKKKKKKKTKKSKRGKIESSSDEADINVDLPLIVNKNMELPEGATLSDTESTHDNLDDPHRALDIDLDIVSPHENKVPAVSDKKKPKKKKEKKKVEKRHDSHEVVNLLETGVKEKKVKKAKKGETEKARV